MADIEALMKRCQIGVPRGPNAYDDLHSILAECYGTLGKLRDQLHLAEVVRAAQVEGLVQGVAGWRERATQLEAQVAALTAERDEAREQVEIYGAERDEARAAWSNRTRELERMEAQVAALEVEVREISGGAGVYMGLLVDCIAVLHTIDPDDSDEAEKLRDLLDAIDRALAPTRNKGALL